MASKPVYLQLYKVKVQIPESDTESDIIEIQVAVPKGAIEFGDVQKKAEDLLLDLGHKDAQIIGITVGGQLVSLQKDRIYVLMESTCGDH